MRRFKLYVLSVLFFVIFMWMLLKGVKLKDYVEVELNGNILCLSCIGIE
jgi:hypothetical protein